MDRLYPGIVNTGSLSWGDMSITLSELPSQRANTQGLAGSKSHDDIGMLDIVYVTGAQDLDLPTRFVSIYLRYSQSYVGLGVEISVSLLGNRKEQSKIVIIHAFSGSRWKLGLELQSSRW